MRRRWPTWIWGYVVLAGFSLATVLGGLAVGIRLADRFAASVTENARLAAQLERYRHLVQLAANANAPGNDLFSSLDPVGERRRLRIAHRAFIDALAPVRDGLQSDPALASDAAVLARLQDAVEHMVIDAETLLDRWSADDETGASVVMASMDRRLGEVLTIISALSTHAHDLQLARLDAHRDAVLWLRRQQNAVGVLVGLMVVGLVVYGVRLAREARRTEEHETEMLATVSHELRTPLASLLGFTELLLARDYPPEKRREFLHIVHDEAVRLTDLVNDFLDLQRLEANDVAMVPVPVELRPLIVDASRVFLEPSASHRLRLQVPDDLPLVGGNADGLRQVLANLLSNAVKYSPDGGVIQVGAGVEGAMVRVWVTDAGIGIPADALPRLFGKFFRVDNGERRRIGGTGLGLALVKRIVERHGGTVGVESTPGRGSTFWIALPAIEPIARTG